MIPFLRSLAHMGGACFDLTGGVGAAAAGAAQAAGTVAATSMQVKALQDARKTAINTANEVAPTLTQSATDANALLNPYVSTGNNAINALSGGMTQEFLESTPGYQFIKNQGLQGVTNAAAARGLANSGAALKGAAAYATGLADQTYQNQFNNYKSLADLGGQAATAQGNNTINAATNAGNIRMAGANGGAAAAVGAGNALAGGLSSLGSTIGSIRFIMRCLMEKDRPSITTTSHR